LSSLSFTSCITPFDNLNKISNRIGSGTGIFTRALLAHAKWNPLIRELRAIEPSEGMREVFSRTVKDDRVTVSEGTFQSTGVEDGWADVVVSAQVCAHVYLP